MIVRGMSGFLRTDAALAMLARGSQGAAMGVAAMFVVWSLSPTDQGFYFAFISFGILLQLCDFGLSYAGLQAASHLLATGRSDELSGLASLALRINVVVTAIASIAVAALGWWMFTRTPHDASVAWFAPWFAFIACVGLNHLTAPYIFLVEGGLSVTRAWRFRLIQEVASGCAMLVVLAAGHGLWSLVAYYGMRATSGALWMSRVSLGGAGRAAATAFTLARWRDELWPFQWRVGTSAVSVYLVYQAFGPILFALHGPADAGRFALSLAVMNAIVMVTTAWPISQAAHFGVLLGRRQGHDLTARWHHVLSQSTAFAVLGAALTMAAFIVLWRVAPDVATRFADPVTTAMLIASAIAHHVIACISVVLRSERRDPLLLLGIVAGLVTVALMTLAALRGELPMIALAYLLCTWATVPMAWSVYRRFAFRQRATSPSKT